MSDDGTPRLVSGLIALGFTGFSVLWWRRVLWPEGASGSASNGFLSGKPDRRLPTLALDGVHDARLAYARVVEDANADTPVAKKGDIDPIEGRVGVIRDLILKYGEQPKIVELAREIVSQKCGSKFCVKEKDWTGEARAIFDYCRSNVRYVRDPTRRDTFSAPDRILAKRAGDCFHAGTKLLGRGHKFVNVEDVKAGDRIWGRDRWSVVQRVWAKGLLAFDAITLNNGSTFKLTPDHKVFVAVCSHKHKDDENERACCVGIDQRTIERRAVAELREEDVLVSPERLAFGEETPDPDRTYIEGLYIADGWCSEPYRFSISGKDGHPKEAQKREVQAICERLGLNTRWHDRYITINDKEWASQMATMGSHAPDKRAPSLNLGEAAAAALLRGIMADSGVNTNAAQTRTFTTTSRLLAMQVRVLHKMFGVTCGYAYIEDHGGLGDHPIYRLYTRGRKDGKAEKLLRVRSIEREVISLPAYDIATDDHYVYLPEADVTVSNCDDYSVLLSSLLLAIGTPRIKLRVIHTRDRSGKPSPDWDHIYVVASPDGRKWIPLDGSVNKPAGWEAEGAATVARSGKPAGIVYRVRDFTVV